MKVKLETIIFFLLNIIFISCSMDTFLNIKLFGFSLRFVFIPMIVLIVFGAIHLLSNKKSNHKVLFLGIVPVFIWLLFLIAFIPNTTILFRNIAYVIWLVIYLTFVPVIAHFIKNQMQLMKMLRYYLYSFFLVACFAIAQFILGTINIDLLIQQRWLNGVPRASGFSYEPSYLATYMLLGWAICFYLITSKSQWCKYLNCNRNIIFISIAIILSGSRMGILFLLFIPFVYVLFSLKSIFTRFQIKKNAIQYLIAIAVFTSSGLVYFTYNFDQALIYMNGLGVYGTVGHSYDMRSNDQKHTLEAFLRSPVIGYSLGGLPTQVALARGKSIKTQEEAKNYEGLNIFAEILAASGIFGFCFFMAFLYIIFSKNWRLIKFLKRIHPEWGKIIGALLLSFFCELMILIFNQNILRAYLWVHIAIVNCAFYVMMKFLKQKFESENIELLHVGPKN